MDKLPFETPNLTDQNIEKIAALFPNVITEIKDEERSTPEHTVYKKGINFELLKQELSGDVVDGDECYDFTWVGKKACIVEGNKPVRKTLRPCVEESKNWETTRNLYIEGDNLDVLKLLQESYLNSIKMIYIDPPYNTGNDFIYKDDFAMDRDEYDDQIGVYDDDENRLFQNSETNGRFHSDWCSMMYPRLKLAQNLLTDDGVIFISIDDNEVHNLRKMCDEVFGESNFVANIVWKHTQQSKNDEPHFSRQYNYNLVYCKDKSTLDEFYFDRTEEDNKNYSNPDHDPKGLWRSGDVRSPNYRKTLCYDIKAPDGHIISSPSNGWRWSEESMKMKIDTGEVIFKKEYTGIIRKIYLSDQPGRTPENLWEGDRFGTTRQASALIKDLFGEAIFDTPKPIELIENMLRIASNNDAVVLDFFSGSATTAHAVMKLNAEDGGNRKFIMVQLPEPCEKKSEAYKAGYKNICEIGKERIRRAGEKIKAEVEEKNAQLKMDEKPKQVPDIGFRVLKLDDTNMKKVYYSADEYSQSMLGEMESNIKEDRTDMDLLYGVLLDWGLKLTDSHKIVELNGTRVHCYNFAEESCGENGLPADCALMACFADQVGEDVIRAIAKSKPQRVVFRDSSFTGSPEKINVTEIFKLLAPDTSVKVI